MLQSHPIVSSVVLGERSKPADSAGHRSACEVVGHVLGLKQLGQLKTSFSLEKFDIKDLLLQMM